MDELWLKMRRIFSVKSIQVGGDTGVSLRTSNLGKTGQFWKFAAVRPVNISMSGDKIKCEHNPQPPQQGAHGGQHGGRG